MAALFLKDEPIELELRVIMSKFATCTTQTRSCERLKGVTINLQELWLINVPIDRNHGFGLIRTPNRVLADNKRKLGRRIRFKQSQFNPRGGLILFNSGLNRVLNAKRSHQGIRTYATQSEHYINSVHITAKPSGRCMICLVSGWVPTTTFYCSLYWWLSRRTIGNNPVETGLIYLIFL